MTTLLTPINAEYNREQLILDYYPLVRAIACRMARRLPPTGVRAARTASWYAVTA